MTFNEMANVASQRAVNRANLCTDERRECVVLLMSCNEARDKSDNELIVLYTLDTIKKEKKDIAFSGYLRITPYLGSNCNRQPGSLTAMSTRL
ncbi:hypothetical protein HZH68_009113 [Vespula germanica]|uniref:Uncharacterized protein n=1 Tax=Vespula germanica TaxID=30212 RepID=A0A834K5Y0_VESGE|nr:hypothetical protein HZH68_009113 [Vespula germanica]